MRQHRIRDTEKLARRLMREERCMAGSWLCYSVDEQVDCVWLT